MRCGEGTQLRRGQALDLRGRDQRQLVVDAILELVSIEGTDLRAAQDHHVAGFDGIDLRAAHLRDLGRAQQFDVSRGQARDLTGGQIGDLAGADGTDGRHEGFAVCGRADGD